MAKSCLALNCDVETRERERTDHKSSTSLTHRSIYSCASRQQKLFLPTQLADKMTRIDVTAAVVVVGSATTYSSNYIYMYLK